MTTASKTVLPAPDAVITRPPTNLWSDAWRRMKRNRMAMVSLVFLAILLLTAIFADVIAPYPYQKTDILRPDDGPSALHLFGTDYLGRDLLSRIIYGGRISLAVALVDVGIVLLIGVPLGLLAGFYGRLVDTLVMRTVDILYALPNLLFIIVVMMWIKSVLDLPSSAIGAVLGPIDKLTGGLLGVFLALSVLSWLTVARLVRGQTLSLKQKEFVEAARTVGAGNARIMFNHMLPNVMGPIIVAATFGIPGAVATEAGLSFLGLGVRPPLPSWGVLIADGQRSMQTFPHELAFPAGILALTLICFNFVGDGLRDALDPKMKQ